MMNADDDTAKVQAALNAALERAPGVLRVVDQHSSAANIRLYRNICAVEVHEARLAMREPVQPSLRLDAFSEARLAAAEARRARRAKRSAGR